MRRVKLVLTITIIALAGIAAAQEPGKAPEGPPHSAADSILRVTCDAHSGLGSRQLLENLAASSALLKDAIAEVSPEAAKSAKLDVGITFPPGPQFDNLPAGEVVMIALHAVSHDPRVPVDKLLDKFAEALSRKLRDLDSELEGELRKEALARDELMRLQLQLSKKYDEFRTLAALHKVSTVAGVDAQKRTRLEAEMQGLDAELVGLTARHGALEGQIAQLGTQVAKDMDSDPVVQQLKTSVDVREQIRSVVRTKAAAATVTHEDVLKSEDSLAQAKAELAKYRREAAEGAGGRRIAELRRKLDDTSIEMSEIKARREALEQQYRETPHSADVEMQRIGLEVLERDYRNATEELGKLRAKLRRYLPPKVTVIPVQ